MKKLKLAKSPFVRYYAQILLAIIAFTFFTRVYNLHNPEKYVFDEVYHAVTAKLILHQDVRAYEWSNPPPEPNTAVDWLHPPLAKYTQAASMAAFGETSFGWRFSSVIFGCLVVLLTAKIAFALFKSHTIALLAASLTSVDGLVLTMSRIAMNDIHVTTFILMTIYFYILFFNSEYKDKKLLLLSGLSGGLAIGTKWSGLLVIGAVSTLEAIRILRPQLLAVIKTKNLKKFQFKKVLTQALYAMTVMLLIPSVIYILSYSHMFLLGKDFKHLVNLHKNIWWYQTSLTATHPAQSQPIEWFINSKPVWIAVDYVNETTRGDIYAVGNPALFFVGGISVVLSTMFILSQKILKKLSKKMKLEKSIPAITLLTFFYFMVWLPWQLSPRIMFFYHYLPAVPLMTILLSFWLHKLYKLEKYKEVAVAIIILIVVAFITWYPHLTLIPVDEMIKENIHFYFDSWNQALRK